MKRIKTLSIAGVRGVTLMELLLAIALIAVISAIGMPQVFHNFTRDSEQHMIESVLVELEYARSMGLMDLPTYATFKTTAGSAEFECATQTKRLDGNVVFVEGLTLRFGPRGQLINYTSGIDLTTDQTLSVKAADKVIGTAVITPAGLIKRQ